MSTIRQLPKLALFPAHMRPDNVISSLSVAEQNKDNVIRTPRILRDGAFSWTLPEERKQYKYLTASPQALHDLGLDPAEPDSPEFRDVVSGQVYHGSFQDAGYPYPYSQCYAGWQFGQFAGQLGDGRVHNLFEVPKGDHVVLPSNTNRKTYEVQLKGSGKTPYSRFADGKAVIRSLIREYIISEHLNSIGIPSTRALALTYLPKTYAQRHAAEKCAIVARFAELWIRLGTFDLYRWRFDRHGARQLSDYIITELFSTDGKFPYLTQLLHNKPDLLDDAALGTLTDYDRMYLEIVVRNATTTAMWQCYGFLNGVLNTDNTSVLGLSMDFGPFSIMDKFDPNYTPNSEDHQGRYSYANTPTSIWWNLTRLGEDLALLIGAGDELINELSDKVIIESEDKITRRATKVIEVAGEMYKYAFTKMYVELFFKRLGLSPLLVNAKNPDEQNDELIVPMLAMLKKVQCDFNKFFLTVQSVDVLLPSFDADKFAQSVLLKKVSEHEAYDRDELSALVKDWVEVFQKYAKNGVDKQLSKSVNPVFLPRNWILDEVIAQTQESQCEDLTYLHKLEKMAFNPFDRSKWGDDLKDVEEKWLLQSDIGDDLSMLQCSCSS